MALCTKGRGLEHVLPHNTASVDDGTLQLPRKIYSTVVVVTGWGWGDWLPSNQCSFQRKPPEAALTASMSPFGATNLKTWRGDKRLEVTRVEECDAFRVEKDKSSILNKTCLMIMLPKFNQKCFQNLLTPTQYELLQILVLLLQFHRTVTLEKLATVFPQPIKFESRRRSLQRCLSLSKLSIQILWFPLLKHWLRNSSLKKGKRLTVAIDRTQWRDQNIFVISLIEERRAIPVYWQLVSKRGCSNLGEQKALIRPVLRLFQAYKVLLLEDREFHSVRFAICLHSKQIEFGLRQKKGTYIRQENQPYQRLEMLGLVPEVSFFLEALQVTKHQWFSRFNLAGYYPRKYRGKVEPSGWDLLTNLSSLKAALKAFKQRSGIEAMFKDCKTGGDNLESTYTTN